jgi:tetratricopeptide (TPR) repeat protein
MTSMNRSQLQLLALPLVAACAATETAEHAAPLPAEVAPRLEFSVQDGAPAEPVSGEAAEGAEEVLRDYDLDGETNLWRDPDFRRRFLESYLSESEIEPRVTLEETESLQAVSEFLGQGSTQRAIARLQKDGGPQASAVFDFTLGNIHFQEEELEEAVVAYQRAVEKFPKFLRAWKNIGLIHVRQGEHAAAARAFTRVVELGGGDALVYGLLGFAYTNTRKPIAAESAYRMAMMLDPNTLDWQLGLARSFFSQRRYSDAATLCGELLAAQPDSADLWLLQGNAFVGMGDSMRAAQNFEFVERLGASTPASLNNLGDIYVNEGLFDLAVDAYVRSMELDEEGEIARAVRAARSLTANGALEDATRLIAGIQRLHGNLLLPEERKDLLKLEARIAVAQGLGGEEARLLEEIVQLDPLDGDAIVLLGEHYARHERVEEAIFQYERAATLEGFEAVAKKRHGQLLVNQDRYAEAVPLLKRSLDLEPSDGLKVYLEQVERLAKTSGGSN